MKKFKYIIYMVPLLILGSCIVDEADEVTPGEALAILYAPSDEAFFFNNTSDITIELTFADNPGASITQVNVTKKLVTANGESAPVTFAVTGTTFTQTETELFADVPVDGNVLTENDLDPGDYWVFSYTFTITSGRTLASGDKTKVTFTCESDLGGTYSSVGNGTGGDGLPISANQCGGSWDGTASITITDNGGGQYEISDAVMGFYINHYSCYSNGPQEESFVDICGELTMASYTDIYNDTNVNVMTLNPDGTITLSFSNTYGDNFTGTLTKN